VVDETPPAAVMWSVSQIAERDGITKQAVSKMVRRLAEEHGLAVERNAQGAVTAVNVAAYDHLRQRYGDPSKAQAPLPLAAPPANDSYDEALRQKTWIETERQRIALAETKGELLNAAKVREALQRCGAEIAAVIKRLPNATDDFAATVGREGSHGLRVALNKYSTSQLVEIARILETIASGAPEAEEEAAKDAA
jgi:DNA-binding Lrp family transcriptional regulator